MSDTNREIKRFFKHSSIYAVGSIINRLGAFLLLPIYTNYLTVQEYGALELFYAVLAVIGGLLSVGLAHATLRFYFEYEKEEERGAVVSTNYIGSMLIVVAGSMLVAVWRDEISNMVFGNYDYSLGILMILATIVFELSTQICFSYLRAKEYSILFISIVSVKLVIQVAVNSYLVIVARAGVDGVLFGNLLTVFTGWLILSVFTLNRCGLTFHLEKAIPVLKYSFPFLLSTIVGLISQNVDKFLINGLLTLQALGIYALAIKFSKLLEELIAEPFNRSYGSFRFSIMKMDNASEIQSKIVRYLLAAALASGLAISLYTRDLLKIISDESFWPAADILPILIIASTLKVISYPFQTGILYKKKTRYIFYINVVNAVIATISGYIGIKLFGILGACFALVVVSISDILMTNIISQRYFNVKYEYGKYFIMSLITVMFYMVSIPTNVVSIYISVMLKTVVLILFLIVLLKSGVFDKEEIIAAKKFMYRYIPILKNA